MLTLGNCFCYMCEMGPLIWMGSEHSFKINETTMATCPIISFGPSCCLAVMTVLERFFNLRDLTFRQDGQVPEKSEMDHWMVDSVLHKDCQMHLLWHFQLACSCYGRDILLTGSSVNGNTEPFNRLWTWRERSGMGGNAHSWLCCLDSTFTQRVQSPSEISEVMGQIF